ncbi:MAG: hypothetical protein KKD65_08025, partial [Gammaproteobacteria bacterium]|nr:hypothetical protein [Gammaproteobacteria bacterium]
KGGTLTVGGNIAKASGNSTMNIDGGSLSVGGGNGSIGVDNLVLGSTEGSSGSHTLSGTGSIMVDSEIIGISGAGTFIQSGGTHTVNSFTLGQNSGSSGTYTLNGGTLNISGNILGGAGSSTFNLNGGTLTVGTGNIQVTNFVLGSASGTSGIYTLSGLDSITAINVTVGGAGSGYLSQTGGALTATNLAINDTYSFAGGSLVVNGSMDNSGIFTMAGTTISGTGALVNNASMSGYGTIGGSGGFTNNGLFTQGSGDITLSNSGTNANYGNLDLATTRQLRLSGTILNNGGTLNLNSALVSGTGTLHNVIGGTVAGRGSITSNFNNAGMVAVTGGTLNISKSFSNSGVIEMTGPTSTLAGGAISNSGTIQGHGNVGNAIANTGTIDATGGAMNLSGTVNNNAGGTLRASNGTKVLAVNGLASNAGLISLAGGTVDTNGTALNSTGKIVGYGVLATGGLTNSGSMTLTGGTATVNGNVTNAAAGKIEVAYSPAVFTGDVVNNGQFKTTHTTVTFAGNYTENGTYLSDPSNNYFTNLVVGEFGHLLGGVGDNFFISGNFENYSLQNTLWNTADAALFFNGVVMQSVYLAGADLGALLGGYNSNFAWGKLSLGSGAKLSLFDGNSTSGAALYVGLVDLADGIGELANIYSDYNIYYNAGLAGNAWLGGQTYALGGAGYLMAANAVPVPPALWLLGSGLLGLICVARRKAA